MFIIEISVNKKKFIEMSSFPEAPPNLKTIQPYLKIAIEHDQRDLVGRFVAKVGKLQNLLLICARLDFSRDWRFAGF